MRTVRGFVRAVSLTLTGDYWFARGSAHTEVSSCGNRHSWHLCCCEDNVGLRVTSLSGVAELMKSGDGGWCSGRGLWAAPARPPPALTPGTPPWWWFVAHAGHRLRELDQVWGGQVTGTRSQTWVEQIQGPPSLPGSRQPEVRFLLLLRP